MTIEEALAIIDATLKPKRINDLQELVFRQSWSGKTYQEMASGAGYDHDYIRLVGFQLWQALSNAFGKKITKKNFRSVLRQHLSEGEANGEGNSKIKATIKQGKLPPLELPEGPVSLDSPFYVERPPIEERCYYEILKP